jgi:hypothetical protein
VPVRLGQEAQEVLRRGGGELTARLNFLTRDLGIGF